MRVHGPPPKHGQRCVLTAAARACVIRRHIADCVLRAARAAHAVGSAFLLVTFCFVLTPRPSRPTALRSLVSKKKRRFSEGGFDLDLSYITPNIIAMGYPTEGKESAYRNPYRQVHAFLEKVRPSHARALCVLGSLQGCSATATTTASTTCARRRIGSTTRPRCGFAGPSRVGGFRSFFVVQFNDRVSCYPFEDHHPPPFLLIEAFCRDVQRYLDGGPDRVAAIHWCSAWRAIAALLTVESAARRAKAARAP